MLAKSKMGCKKGRIWATSISLLVVFLVHLLAPVRASDYVCGSQDWFSGWHLENEITYKVMAQSMFTNHMAIGGSTTNPEDFEKNQERDFFDEDDDEGAMIVVFDLTQKDPIYVVAITRCDIGLAEAMVSGVTDITLNRGTHSQPEVYALLKTDLDAQISVIVQYNGSYLKLHRSQHNFGSELMNPKLRAFDQDAIWLFADYLSGSARKQLAVKYQGSSNNNLMLKVSSTNASSQLTDHVLRDVSVTQNYVVRVTEGTCQEDAQPLAIAGPPFQGILVAAIDDSPQLSSFPAYSCSYCYDLSDRDWFDGDGITESYSVVAANAQDDPTKSDLYGVTMVLEGQKSVMTIDTWGCTSSGSRKIYAIKFESLNDIKVRYVSFSDTQMNEVRLLVEDITNGILYPILGIDVYGLSTTFYSYELTFVSQSPSADFNLHTRSPIALQITRDLQLAFLGDDFSWHLLGINDLTSDCLRVNAVLSTEFTRTSFESIVDPEYEVTMDPGTESNINFNSKKENYGGTTYVEAKVNSDSFKNNPCEVRVRDPFKDVVYNILSGTPMPVLDTDSLTIDECPQGSAVTPNDYTRIKEEFGTIMYYCINPNPAQNPPPCVGTPQFISDFSELFINASPGSDDIMSVSPSTTRSWDLTTYSVYYQIGLDIESADEIELYDVSSFTVTLDSYCAFVDPSIDNVVYTIGEGATTTTISGFDADCQFDKTLTNADDSILDAQLFTYSSSTDQLTINTADPSKTGAYTLTFKMWSTIDPTSYSSRTDFTVTVVEVSDSCDPQYDEVSTTTASFVQSSPTFYIIGQPDLNLVFDGVSLNNCPFSLSLYDISEDITSPQAVDTTIFTLNDPVLEQYLSSTNKYTVEDEGSLTIYSSNYATVGSYSLQLTMESNVPGDRETFNYFFEVTVIECESVTQNSQTDYEILSYTIGEPLVDLQTVQALVPACQNSVFSTVTSHDDFIITEDLDLRQVTVSLQSESMTPGLYTVEVWETDVNYGFVAKSFITVEVEAAAPFVGVEISEDDEEEDDNEETNTPISEPETEPEEDNDDEEVSEPEEAEAAIAKEPEPTQVGEQIVYPWQVQVNSNKVEKKVVEKEIVPLRASVLGMTETGNLTIVFNKEIIKPPIRVTSPFNETVSEGRLLSTAVEQIEYLYDIQDVVDIRVESDYFTEEDDEIKVANYTCTRLTERALDIQINFAMPNKITAIESEPDDLYISFKKGLMFMDEDATQLANDLAIKTTIKPQLSKAEIQELEQLSENVASSMAAISIALIILQLFLAMGLKYLWGIMSLLQFLIFMQQWQISLPHTTSIFVKELRKIALYEFIPMDAIKSWIKGVLGVQDEDCGSDVCQSDTSNDSVSFETGIERVGSNSLIDNMGAMLGLLVLISLLLILLLVLFLCMKRSPRAKKYFEALKKKLVYNAFLRYVLQSSLKLQIAACSVIFFDRMLKASSYGAQAGQETPTSSIVTSSAMLLVLNCCPVLFFMLIYRNKENLSKQEIKDRIGTLYIGFNPKKSLIAAQCLLFLLRRSFFVVLTFMLFEQPGIQVQVMIFSTMLFIIFLGNAEYFETPNAKFIEIFNETVFVLIQYNFVLLHNLVWDEQTREQCGNTIVGLASFLLALNMLIIIVVSIKGAIRKCYLNRLKKNAIREHERRKAYTEAQALEKKQQLAAQADCVTTPAKTTEKLIENKEVVQDYENEEDSAQKMLVKKTDLQDLSLQSFIKLDVDEIYERAEGDLLYNNSSKEVKHNETKIPLKNAKNKKQVTKPVVIDKYRLPDLSYLVESNDQKKPTATKISLKPITDLTTQPSAVVRPVLQMVGPQVQITDPPVLRPAAPSQQRRITGPSAYSQFNVGSTFPQRIRLQNQVAFPANRSEQPVTSEEQLSREILSEKTAQLMDELREMTKLFAEQSSAAQKTETRYDALTKN